MKVDITKIDTNLNCDHSNYSLDDVIFSVTLTDHNIKQRSNILRKCIKEGFENMHNSHYYIVPSTIFIKANDGNFLAFMNCEFKNIEISDDELRDVSMKIFDKFSEDISWMGHKYTQY